MLAGKKRFILNQKTFLIPPPVISFQRFGKKISHNFNYKIEI